MESQGDINKSLVKELPIAQRKGARSCTMHPISYFVGYGKLSPSCKSFIANLSNTKVPNNIYGALRRPKWKKAIEDEMRALKKN